MSTRTETSYHHGDLPTALLAAVGEIVEEKGAANVSLREAARRAGVSHSAPAHHFGDKDGLIAAYCHQGFDLMAERMQAALADLDDDAPSPEMISVIGRAYVEFAAENPTHFDVMFRSGLEAVDEAAHDDLERAGAMTMLEGLVGQLVASGMIDEQDAQVIAALLWSQVHGLASLWVDGAIAKMFPGMELDRLLDAAFGPAQLAFTTATEPFFTGSVASPGRNGD